MSGPGADRGLEAFESEAPTRTVSAWTLLVWLSGYLRRGAPALVGGLVASLAGMAMAAVRPVVMGSIVDAAHAGERASFIRGGATLAGLVVALQVVGYFQALLLQAGSLRATRVMREDIFRLAMRVRMSHLDRVPVARLIMVATADVLVVFEFLAAGGLLTFLDGLLVVVILVAMTIVDVKGTLVVMSVVTLLGLVVLASWSRARRFFAEERVRMARVSAELLGQIAGIALIQSYGKEAAMDRRFGAANSAWLETSKKNATMSALIDASVEGASILAIAVLVSWVGFSSRGADPASFGVVVTFSSYIYLLFDPLRRLTRGTSLVQQGLAALERTYLFCRDTPLERLDPELPPAEAPARADGPAIALRGVSFSYGGDPVLRDVSFALAEGEHVAVVGRTGAGKSTLARLLLRFYDATEGTIAVGGRDVRSWPVRELRRSFALVSQDVHLFEGTIAENVAPDPDAFDRARVERTVADLGVLAVFAPRGGLDAEIREGGANLSAGERQLVALARAVYLGAPFLVLDEATANIDSDLERTLQRAMKAALVGRTALIIAHRLATVREMDRVLVLDGGRLVESGTHDELVARGGVYANLSAELSRASQPGEGSVAAVVAPAIHSTSPRGVP